MKSTHAAILFSLVFAFGTAQAQMAKEPGDTAAEAVPASSAEVSAAVGSCLEKAASGQYQSAIPACTRAAELAPQNEHVQAALAKAQEAAGIAGAEAATAGAEAAASDAAGAAVPSVSSAPADAAKAAEESLKDKAGGFLK